MTNTPEFNQMISQYVDQIEELFEYVEKESDSIIAKTHSPGGSSPASPALTRSGLHSSSNGDSGVHRAEAPTPTKCFLMGGYTYRPRRRRGGGGGNGGAMTVNILNSVGNMTAQIINASANAAAVILPPVAEGLGNALGNLASGNSPPQQPPPYPPPYPPPPPPPPPPPQQPPPPPPQGQWVWHNGQWVWVPAGQQPPPGSQGQPGGGNASANATAYGGGSAKASAESHGGTATATAQSHPNQPGTTRSKMPQRMDATPGKARDTAARALDSHPAIQKGYQEIDYTLQDMDKCVDGILSKFD